MLIAADLVLKSATLKLKYSELTMFVLFGV